MTRILALIAGAAVLAFGIYTVYDAIYGPPRVVLKYGKVTARSSADPAKVAERRIRQVQRGRKTYWQVELLDGSWLDCEADCGETYRLRELDVEAKPKAPQ